MMAHATKSHTLRGQLGLLLLTILVSSCGGGGGDDGPSAPATGSISGYVTIPGTTGEDPPVVVAAATSLTLHAAVSDLPVQVPAKHAHTRVAAGRFTAAAAAEPVELATLHVHFRWRPGTTEQRRQEILATERLEVAGAGFGMLVGYRIETSDSPEAVCAQLAVYPELLNLSVVPPVRSLLTPPDSGYVHQWNLTNMGMERAWDITRGSSSIRVAVLDSGMQIDHPEFLGRLVDGYDFVSDPVKSGDGDGPDSDATDTTNLSPGKISHGTHVTGIIAAQYGNDGIVGVDHHCCIIPIRVTVDRTGYLPDILHALIYAADLHDTDLSGFSWFPDTFPDGSGLNPGRPRPSTPANLINMSLGQNFQIPSDSWQVNIMNDIMSAIRLKGISIIVASGNENALINTTSSVVFPAGSPSVITVASVQQNLDRSDFSNYGPEVFVAAPGGGPGNSPVSFDNRILSTNMSPSGTTWPSASYFGLSQGTSMAAPHVTGVCALMLAVNPTLTPDDITTLLAAACVDLGSPGKDDLYGHGFLLADHAVALAAGAAPPTQLVAYTSGLTFPAAATSAEFLIRNEGGTLAQLGTLSYSVTYDVLGDSWVDMLTSSPVGSDGATITVHVDRAGLSDGSHTATLHLDSTLGGSLAIPLTLVVQNTIPDPSFAAYFVLLLDADTGNPVQQINKVLPSRSFTFTNVPAGRYVIVAGTDLNDDGYIDDPGEYFGIHQPTVELYTIEIGPGENRSTVAIPMTLVDDLSS